MAKKSQTEKQNGKPMRSSDKKCLSVVLALALSVSMPGTSPAIAFATDDTADNATDNEVIATWLNAADKLNDPTYNPYSYATSNASVLSAESTNDATEISTSFPVSYDLRDPNGDGNRNDSVVTPVKLQSPWGTCWSFAIIAACESSILSDLGKTADETNLDLSELQLAGSVFRATGAPAKYVGESQAGEGYHNSSQDPNAGLNAGGFETYGSSVFAAGIGPLSEEEVPYKNAEGIKRCFVEDGSGQEVKFLNDEQIEAMRIKGAQVTELYWAGNYSTDATTMTYTDWSVSEDVWNESLYEFESGNILPSVYYSDESGTHWGNPRTIDAVKSELYDFGRAVAISCNVDAGLDRSTWSVYSDTPTGSNHAVTIVGWSDTYAKENFTKESGGTPEGDGAWLVKNSWGAQGEDFPNYDAQNNWGIVEDGKNSGYFWLSYYDESISRMESFDFDVNTYGDTDEYYLDQYDYMPERSTITSSSDDPVSSANTFTAKGDLVLRTLGSATYRPNSTVTYQVYLLDDQAKSPTDPSHSTLVCSLDDTYRYGGYHRVTLSEDQWIPMRKGQRYAVVTTQKCNDDGKYYQGVAMNTAQPTEQEVQDYRATLKQEREQAYYSAEYYFAYRKYIAQGMSDAEAQVQADKDAKLAVQNAQELINQQVESQVDEYANRYFVAKVNPGESWTSKATGLWIRSDSDSDNENGQDTDTGDGEEGTSASAGGAGANTDANTGPGAGTGGAGTGGAGASAQTEWTDWSVVAEALKDRYVMADNLSIKAFSELRSWASVDELASLDAEIAQAAEKLANAKISADGHDVPTTQTWMTQEQYDAASAALDQARATLALAGNYASELTNTTPSPEEVTNAISSLSFESQPGKGPGSADGEGGEGDSSADGSTAGGSTAGGEAEGDDTDTCGPLPASGDTARATSTLPASGDAVGTLAVQLACAAVLSGIVTLCMLAGRGGRAMLRAQSVLARVQGRDPR